MVVCSGCWRELIVCLQVMQMIPTAKVVKNLVSTYNFDAGIVNRAILNLTKRGAIQLKHNREKLVNLGGA